MGIFQKIKNKLGIGGVKVNLMVPPQIEKSTGSVSGKIALTTKSEQEILSINISMKKKVTTGSGDKKKTRSYDLGEMNLPGGFSIKPRELKEFEFTLPFATTKSAIDRLKEEDGVLGAIGKVAAFTSSEKSRYYVEADIDVQSAALDPSDKVQIQLI